MIAFDIDGCVNGIKADLIRLGKDFFSEYPVVCNESGYYLKEMFPGAPESSYDEFWQKYGYDIHTAPPLDGVRETIGCLKEHHIDACYITARDRQRTFRGIPFDDLTSEWLRSYGIDLPVWYCKEKVNAVTSLGVTVMVEDKPGTILKLQDITEVLIFRHKYNEHLKGTFVSDWYEIRERLTQMCCDV